MTMRRATPLSASASASASSLSNAAVHHRRECDEEKQLVQNTSGTRRWWMMLLLVAVVISSPQQHPSTMYGVRAFQQQQRHPPRDPQLQFSSFYSRILTQRSQTKCNHCYQPVSRSHLILHSSNRRYNNKMFPLLVSTQSNENYDNNMMAATNASTVFEEPSATAVAVATTATTFDDVNSMMIDDDDYNDNNNNNILVRSWKKLRAASKVDTATIAKLGIAFGLTYNIISNINGSISLSMAWYIASKKTGLSPLAPGQWKSLLAAYGTLYMVICLMRPLRLALAVAMTRKTESFLQYLQDRLGCTRAVAIGLKISLGLVVWGCMCTLGVSLASAASGVPIWKTAH
eukprot:CAMPEP_0113472520 /NCGR_PEP_ID=MMETSP0014_2-20120614/17558_1 /TAXON_ID=2857 /ORGANISM="Nitzschia sp." /LENGTH=344 /DNA_ID=CAMNT_0000365233 /DNA_START=240 /DNA_END=1274 /DNA_ORIENTATION=+ /assembly_acc=CAM_ASM_000159